MVLSWAVVAAVLGGALLHAGWNALVKSSNHKELDTAVIHVVGALMAIPMVAAAGWPSAKAWPYIATSTLIHMGYFMALTGAYKHGDLGLTYPLMRGVAPLLVALFATLTVGESIAPWAWVGIGGISLGVLVIGVGRQAAASAKAIGFALLNAVFIAGYTLVDALGVRASGNSGQYISSLFLLTGWPFALLMAAKHRRTLAGYVRTRWRLAPLAGLGAAASLASYGIALWAMARAPVALIAALRETSVLFAVLLGALLLKEPFTPRRFMGTCVIVAGVMILRLS